MIRRVLWRWFRRSALASLVLGVLALGVFAFCWWRYPFPLDRLERWGESPLVTDRMGGVLIERVSDDGQWRRAVALEEMSPFLRDATVAVEDARFEDHAGVDALAVGRALWQNTTSGEVVSGASTLTMQVCRMMDDRPRTFQAKAVESFRALQLEQLYSKDEILALYLNMAPYGGNLRGVEQASLAYFGKPASRLSLGEAALLAGLPQSPERLRPDRDPEAAKRRRATVLERMHVAGYITAAQRDAAACEPVVLRSAEHRAPDATHVAWMALARRPDGGRTTIDPVVQTLTSEAVTRHAAHLPPGSDIAVVVIDIATGELRALVGSADATDQVDGQVNGALARRSPGSALKPLIYAAAFDAGRLNRDALLDDVPIRRDGWEPGNFDRRFRGEVSAGEALQESLNVPAILVAEGVGLSRCVGVMRAAGLGLPEDTAQRGGLSLAVGGIEVTLLDLTNSYATLGRGGVYRNVRLFPDEAVVESVALAPATAASINDILSNRHRLPNTGLASPDDASGWLMWKTGTSAARRDALAVGHNGRYAVGVWVGRFAGGGDYQYTGRSSAEPLLAALFAHPVLRAMDAPPPAPVLAVRRPIARVALGAAAELRITSPTDGSAFVAWDGAVRLTAEATGRSAAWFLNGELIATTAPPRLELLPGRYELTCVGVGRERDTVWIEVTGSP
ncbi:MAG: penicillin-binding protein 1C [Phycisphaerales bacterium JB063]